MSTTSLNESQGLSWKHYDSLINELKCPGCAEPMEPPIKSCITGHSVCNKCPQKMEKCPLCREKFSEIRSYTLEALILKAHFKCSNKNCYARLNVKLMKWHKERCVYRIIPCMMGKVYHDCDWNGPEIEWLPHCEEAHSDKIYREPCVELSWNYKEDNMRHFQSIISYYILQAHEETFNLYQVYDKNKAKVIWTVICHSKEPKINSRFAFELEIYSPTDISKLSVQRFSCHAEKDSVILDDGKCGKIKIGDAIRFMGNDKILHYRVKIIQVTRTNTAILSEEKVCEQQVPVDYSQTKFEHVNYKGIPDEQIICRKVDNLEVEARECVKAENGDNVEKPSPVPVNVLKKPPRLSERNKFLFGCTMPDMETENIPMFPIVSADDEKVVENI